MITLTKRFFFLMAGVFFMTNIFGCSRVKFEKYSSRDAQLNISMDYIAGWTHRETRGSNNSYTQVTFLPGEKSANWTMVDLVVKESSKIGIPDPTLQGVENDLLAKRMRFKDAKVISKTKADIMGSGAVVIELFYHVPEDLRKADSKFIPVKEGVIILSKGNKFYFLRYMNSAKEFGKYKSAFMHIARSMKIKGNK